MDRGHEEEEELEELEQLEQQQQQQQYRAIPADRTKMHALLLLAQLCFAGFEVLSRLVLVQGMSPYVLAFYRNALAFAVLFPLSCILERQKRPPLSAAIVGRFALLGFVGVFINQVCYYTGLKFTSATFTSAMLNSTPAYTFLLAVVLRLEKVRITRRDGLAKMSGTVLGVAGALVMILYKGPSVFHLLTGSHAPRFAMASWDIGAISLVFTCFSFAVYLTLQAPLFKEYPAPLSVASGSAFFGAAYLGALAVVMEPHISRWYLDGTVQIISVFYAGFIASGFVAAIQSWGVRMRRGGPVIVSAYQPLETMIVAVLSILVLKETLYLGSVLGALLVIIGLYVVIWGQAEDKKFTMRKLVASSPETDPLLLA